MYFRIVTERWSATGGITAVSRAVPPSTRACSMGFDVSRRRLVPERIRAMIWRFSSSEVGAVSACNRPDASMKVTRSPSMKISSMSRRLRMAVSGP